MSPYRAEKQKIGKESLLDFGICQLSLVYHRAIEKRM